MKWTTARKYSVNILDDVVIKCSYSIFPKTTENNFKNFYLVVTL